MNAIRTLHQALFDELERQGALAAGIDVAGLTSAIAARFHLSEIDPLGLMRQPHSRCANGACEG